VDSLKAVSSGSGDCDAGGLLGMNGTGLGQAGLPRGRVTRRVRVRAFMRRQSDRSPTPGQLKFDIAFGFVLPLACFVLDPFVFKTLNGGGGMLERFQTFAYVLTALEMLTLCLWLVARGRLGEWAPAAGGVLLAGALFCSAVGLVLLPFSIVGLVFIVGALGFTPLLAGFVYLRNGARAVRLARNQHGFGVNFCGALVVGAALAFGVSALAGAGVSRFVSASVEGLLAGRDLSAAEFVALRLAVWLTDEEFDRLAWAYNAEADPARKARLAAAYRAATGGDAEARVYLLND
jgi:hypothetical protein